MNFKTRYVCGGCDDEYETKKEADECCGGYEIYVCDECDERYDDQKEAEVCCS